MSLMTLPTDEIEALSLLANKARALSNVIGVAMYGNNESKPTVEDLFTVNCLLGDMLETIETKLDQAQIKQG